MVYPAPLGKPADPRYESLANFANLQLYKEGALPGSFSKDLKELMYKII